MRGGKQTRITAKSLHLYMCKDMRTLWRRLQASLMFLTERVSLFLGVQCAAGLTTNPGATSIADCAVTVTPPAVVTKRLALTAPSILKYPTVAATGTNGAFENFTEGGYAFSASSYIGATSSTFLGRLFDGVLPSSQGGGTASPKYAAGNIISNAVFIVSGYPGEWIKVEMPAAIYLVYVKTYMRSTQHPRAPGDYRVYGSNDDSAWDLLIDTVGATYESDPSIAPAKVHKSAEVTPTNKYRYLAICVNRLFGGPDDVMLNFEELEFYGSEDRWCDLSACVAGQEYGTCDNNSPSTVPTCKQVRGAYHPHLRGVLRSPWVVPVGSQKGRCEE
jgi:hypothetical protein